MSTFIFTWNPTKWSWEENGYEDEITETELGHIVLGQWSIGGRKYGVEPGDKAVLMRQHDHRGLVAAAIIESEIFEDEHWDGSGNPERYCELAFEDILRPEDGLPVVLLKNEIPEVPWDRLQGSGVRVPDEVEDKLYALWDSHLHSVGRSKPVRPKMSASSEVYGEVLGLGGQFSIIQDVNEKSSGHEIWFTPRGVVHSADSRNEKMAEALELHEALAWLATRFETEAAGVRANG